MKKSVTTLNPKAKAKNNKKENNQKLLIGIQTILSIALIILGIITLINKNLIPIFQLVCGLTIIDMGINNHIIYKRPKLTLIYFIFGGIFIILFIMKGLGL